MKKIISIMLALILSLSVLCVGASAAEDTTKTEALLAELAEEKSIKIDFADDAFDNDVIKISNVVVSAKIVEGEEGIEDVKIFATAKVMFFKIKLLVSEGKVFIYIPLFRAKINVTEILGEDIDLLEPAQEIVALLESDFLEYLILADSGEKEIAPHGNVYTEEYKVDMEAIIKQLIEDGKLEAPEDIDFSNMTLEEILAMMDDAEETAKLIEAAESFRAEFIYKNDSLVDIMITAIDEDGETEETLISDIIPFAIESITTDVDDGDFKEPILYFNFSGLFSGLVGKLAGAL